MRIAKPASIAILFFYIFLLYGTVISVFGPCVTSVEESYGLGHSAMWWVFASGSLGYLLGLAFGARLFRPVGLVRAVWLSGICQGVFLFAISATNSWPIFVGSFFFLGLAGGVMEPAWAAAMRALYPANTRQMMNLTHVGTGMGALMGPLLASAILAAGWSWRWVFGLPGIAGMLVMACVPEEPKACSENEALSEDSRAAGNGRIPFGDPLLWLFFLAMLFYAGGELGLSSWTSAFFEKSRGLSKSAAGLAPLCLWTGILLGRAAITLVGKAGSSRVIVAVLSCLGGVAAAGMLVVESQAWAFVLLLAAGAALGPLWPTIVDYAGHRLKTNSSKVLAFIILGGAFGSIFQAMIGPIADRYSLRAGLAGAVALLFGITICFAIERLFDKRQSA